LTSLGHEILNLDLILLKTVNANQSSHPISKKKKKEPHHKKEDVSARIKLP
jgi:hypothetical protein